jgi:hypothetical protein
MPTFFVLLIGDPHSTKFRASGISFRILHLIFVRQIFILGQQIKFHPKIRDENIVSQKWTQFLALVAQKPGNLIFYK